MRNKQLTSENCWQKNLMRQRTSKRKLLYENQIALTEFLIKHVKEVTAYAEDNPYVTVTSGGYISATPVLNDSLGFDSRLTGIYEKPFCFLDRR